MTPTPEPAPFRTIRAWYRGLPDQWRATLRSAWQSVLGTVGLFLLGALAVATDLLSGGTAEDAVTDLSNLARLAVVAIVGILSGLVTFVMNRSGASGGAKYRG